MFRILILLAALSIAGMLPALAQGRQAAPYTPTAEERSRLDEKKQALADRLKGLPEKTAHRADAAVFLHVAAMADLLRLYTGKAQVETVLRGLDTGLRRCELLAKGEAPWTAQPGRSLRGYVSRIDGSVQPYGVVVPAGYDLARAKMRLDVVLHGRGPTEVTFLQQMEPANPGKAPEEPFIELHPFGRANNGWRWAGETDVFEALDAVRKEYRIDPDRTVLRGFSMGGHGAWHIGVHYPDLWSAVSPGAGFSETRRYARLADVPSYQESAWHLYDAVDYALNLANTPFIAYGGEKDPQLQASLNMKEAAAKEGLALNLIVGPNTEHRYHPDSLAEIMRQLATHRRDPSPKQVKFDTWTLRYNRCFWVTLDALGEHYRRARVIADASTPVVKVTTENITALTLDPPTQRVPGGSRTLRIDGQTLTLPRGGPAQLVRKAGKWKVEGDPKAEGGRRKAEGPNAEHRTPNAVPKHHGLQGPIDDAFTDRFLVVRGTGTPWQASTQSFVDAALKRFQDEWRLGFRGEVPLKDDRAAVPADWADANLVLFGDPQSNSVLARVAAKLPIRWTRDGLEAGGKKYGPECLPVLVYPNPLNPRRYVVVNSGHTWTERDIQGTNALLFPKLPDWAVLKPGAGSPEVLAAGFFDESWAFK